MMWSRLSLTEQRIVLVGAGSGFTPGLLADITTTEGLRGSTIVLFDLRKEGLEALVKYALRAVQETRSAMTVESTTDRETALEDADFVISTIRVGGYEANYSDLAVPERHGVVQTVGDTTGPGGLFYGFRNIPAIIEICRDMERLCPRARLLNFTNPMSSICFAVRRFTRIRVVGLCHGIFGTMRALANLLGVERNRLGGRAGGINHLTWLADFHIDEADAYPLLREKISRSAIKPSSSVGPVSVKLFEIYGLFPSPGDRHICEFFPWFLSREANYGRDYGLEKWVESRLEMYADAEALYRRKKERENSLLAQAEGRAPFQLRRSEEIAVRIIDSIANNKRALYEAANIPNEGCIKNLPPEAEVEVPVVVDASGVHGFALGKLPTAIAGILNSHIVKQMLAAEAAVTRNREMAFQALLMDPLISSVEHAESIFTELLEAHAKHLPSFQK